MEYIIFIDQPDRNTIIEIDKTIKEKLFKFNEEDKRNFEYGYYVIRTYKFINKYFDNSLRSFMEDTCIPKRSEMMIYIGIAREYLEIKIVQNIKNKCEECDRNLETYDTHCINCGLINSYMFPVNKENETTLCKSSYSQRGKIIKAIKEFEGFEPVSEEIINTVKDEIVKRCLKVVKRDNINEILHDLRLNKVYKNMNYIYYKVTGTKPISLDDILDKILELYSEYEIAYNYVKNPDRLNSLNTRFVFYKILRILKPEYARDFFVLKTETKNNEHEDMWEKICNITGWPNY